MRRFFTTRPSKAAVALMALNVAAVLGYGAVSVMATDTELDAPNRVFPYNGVLELDGAAYSGQADFVFTVSDGEPDPACTFTEEHEDVDVYGGRFAVNIGSVLGAVDPCVFDSERVYIEIGVRRFDDTTPHRPLSGRQRIHPVPFAYWAAEGSDMRIDGALNVEGAIVAGGGLDVTGQSTLRGTLDMQGQQLRTGTITDLTSINAGGNAFSTGGDLSVGGNLSAGNNLTVANDLTVTRNITGNRNLNISGTVFAGTYRNSGGEINLDDNVNVTGTLTAQNNLNVQGNLIANNNSYNGCSWTSWKRIARNCDDPNRFGQDGACNDSNDSPDFNNYNDLECSNGRFVVGIDITYSQDNDRLNDGWVSLYCCGL